MGEHTTTTAAVPASRRSPWLLAACSLALWWLVGCSSTPPTGGGVVFDGASAIDAAGEDVGPEDAADDATVADTGSGAGQSDGGADDVVDPDAAEPDATADPCEALGASYDGLVPGALACEDDWFCSLAIPDKLQCPCQTMANPTNAATSEALGLLQSWNEKQCGSGFCADLECPDFTTRVGRCEEGGCVAVEATCDTVSAAWVKLAQHLRSCTVDADCSATMPLTPGCPGCTIPVNANADQPEPYGQYIAQLTLVFNDYLVCDAGSCGCDTSDKVPKCVSGICQAVAR